MPEMRSVFSSHINQIGYDPETQEFHVTFSNGRTAIYQDVPQNVARDVMEAPSIGEEVWRSLRGKFKHSYAGG